MLPQPRSTQGSSTIAIARGMPISGYDAQIAAICRANDASLATRNEKDFASVGIEIINPWSVALASTPVATGDS